MELDEKQRMMIAAAVGVLLVGVLLYLTYSARKQKELAEQNIATYMKKTRDARDKIKQIPALRQEEFQLDNDVKEYVRILPKEAEINKLYEIVNDLKDEAGVKLERYTIGREAKGRKKMSASFQTHTRDLKLKGKFFSVAKFINLIERYKRFMRVESFDLKPGGDEGVDELDASLKFSTFTYTPRVSSKAKRKAKE